MSHCIVSNIPRCYRSADLRRHFKQFTENGAFECFHFKHRPEERNAPQQADSEQTFCCVVKVKDSQCAKFIETYHHKRWHTEPSKTGEFPNVGVAVIIRTKINDSLAKLPELIPPKVMPSGNVGTPAATFLSLVNKCLLPPAVIKKLRLEFPRTVKRKQYSAVPPSDLYKHPYYYTYESEPYEPSTSERSEESGEPSTSSSKASYWSEAEQAEEHDGAEDWERHEAFNNDVGTQDRTKERLYEEDMEIVWDKGSSGLVFYTDGNYWADLEGKDTDGLWTDEWDVDMGIYEGQTGDKDARDSQDMRSSNQFRKFGDVDERIGNFEKHTKGFGSRLMKEQGWTEGQGLGKSKEGIPEPVSTEGTQNPKDKSGFGYRGESICDVIRRNNPKRREQPLIGSKFDDVIDHKDSARRSEDPTAMKYRRTNK